MNTMTETRTVNGIDTGLLRGAIDAISNDPAKGMPHWELAEHFNLATAVPLKSRLVVM